MTTNIIGSQEREIVELHQRAQAAYWLGGDDAATIARDELQECVGELANLREHVAEGMLPQGIVLPLNAVAMWAMQQAWCAAVEDDEALNAERKDLDDEGYEEVLQVETKDAVRGFMDEHLGIEVHEDCIFPSDAPHAFWVMEWTSSGERWWRRPTLAQELVAYAPKMKADLEACIEGDGCRIERISPSKKLFREHGPVEQRARALLHLYLVDVVALIASRLPDTKAAAV